MSTPIIFRDVDFHQYTITEDCTIYKNNEIVPMDDIIYHSTNGYDYVLLETLSGELKLYRLEFIMVSSFNPGLQNKWEHFKVNHSDGDIKNCHIDNLTFEEDVEEWRIIEYPETVKRNMYAISSWGRVKNIKMDKNLAMLNDGNGYHRVHLMSFNTKTFQGVGIVHRLVGLHFINNTNPLEFKFINHIDGVKTNNHYSNLEWVTNQMNIVHMLRLQLRANITIDEIGLIIDLLTDEKYQGRPSLIYDVIDHSIHPNITYSIINAIKGKRKDYVKISSPKYKLKEIDFKRCNTSKISDSEIDMIISMLLDPRYNGSPKRVFEAIDHMKHPNITCSIVSHVKHSPHEYCRKNSTYDRKSIVFPNTKTISTEDIDMVIELLLDPEIDGRPLDAYNKIDHDRYPYLTYGVVQLIKGKSPTYIRTDSKYDLTNINFKVCKTGVRSKITTDEIDMIIDMLLDPKNHGSPLCVYNEIDHDELPHVTISVVRAIKSKKDTYIREDSRHDLTNIIFPIAT